jgi:hypothetical protein
MKQRTEWLVLMVAMLLMITAFPVFAQDHTEEEFCLDLAAVADPEYLPYEEAWILAGYHLPDFRMFNILVNLARDVTAEGQIGSGSRELEEQFALFMYLTADAASSADVLAVLREEIQTNNPMSDGYSYPGDQAIAIWFRTEVAILSGNMDNLNNWLNVARRDPEVWNHFNFYRAEAFAFGEGTTQDYLNIYFAAKERGVNVNPWDVIDWAPELCAKS